MAAKSWMTSRYDRYMSERVPKWGQRAAGIGWQLQKVRMAIVVPTIVMAIGLAVGSLITLLTGFFVAALLSAILVVLLKRMNAAATQTLGVPITWQSSPPSKSTDYEDWCKKQRIVPYMAGASEPRDE